MIDATAPIAIGPWFADPLHEVLRTIAGKSAVETVAAITVRYQYRLVSGTDEILPSLPVFSAPAAPFNVERITALHALVDSWRTAYQPNPVSGHWAFAITIFSSLDPAIEPPANPARFKPLS